MIRSFRRIFLITICFISVQQLQAQNGSSSRKLFNKNWRFSLANDSSAVNPGYNDSGWRVLNLPHDWSIEGAFSESHPAKPEGGGLPTGVAWYRKTFHVPTSVKNKNVYIDFDGAYQNSEVWINGQYLGKRPNGYISFRYDLSPYLQFGKNNVITVKVDNSDQPNSRWYSGSGIYRNVWLDVTEKVHVAQWGTFVTTPQVSNEEATVNVKTDVSNTSGAAKAIRVKTSIYGKNGKLVSSDIKDLTISGSASDLTQEFKITHPDLWSVENPYLYKAVIEIFEGKKLNHAYETTFGIRYFNFDQKTGFSLNGKPLKILGVCNHHDLGALGAAVNVRAMERQLEILKTMGTNGIRMAHNPPAPELLELCDKMGFIVMNETFDMWAKKKNKNDYHRDFKEWHVRDLEDHIKRDRNHASVFMWSIGNEIREQFDSTGISITRELAAIVKRLDPTRPVTSALTEMIPEKNFIYQSGALDLLGFNYNHAKYDSLPERFVNQKLIASETTSGLMTRGHYDMPSDSIRIWPHNAKTKLTTGNPDWTASAYDNAYAYWGSTHEATWKTVKRQDFMAGLYVWTGFDYLGEPTPYPWPARSSYFGIVDLAGFPKDIYYMYQSEWADKPVLHILPHWNWEAGKTVDVWAYYNQADEVELFLNGTSLGSRKKEGEDLHVMWRVPFQAGTLKAVSRRNGKDVLVKEIKTAGAPAKIELVADRIKVKADGKDMSFVTVRVLDAEGNLVPDADDLIQFTVEGKGFIAGVDNGYQASMEPFKANYRKAFNGLCLAILQTTEGSGKIKLTAKGAGLKPATLSIRSAK